MRSAALLLALTLASPAVAADCDQWSASMQEDEGGPVMTAEICAGPTEAQNVLLVQCFDTGYGFRLLPIVPDNFPPNDNMEYKSKLTLTNAGKTAIVESLFESMDGALAFYPKKSDPAVALFKKGETITITDADKLLPPMTFSLKNAKQAFEKLDKSCAQ